MRSLATISLPPAAARMLRTVVDEEERTGEIPGGREEGEREEREGGRRGKGGRREREGGEGKCHQKGIKACLKYMNDPLQNCAHVLLYFCVNCHKLKEFISTYMYVASCKGK